MDNMIKIAVVDNNEPLRGMTVNQLEKAGLNVLFQADNGQQALEEIIIYGLPDVCIVEEDFDTAKLLLEKHPGLKVLVLTTDDDKESVMAMLKTGVSGYVLKFADPDEIVTAIKALSKNRKYFSVVISRIAAEYFAERP